MLSVSSDLHVLYLMNILSRHTANADLFICENVVELVAELIYVTCRCVTAFPDVSLLPAMADDKRRERGREGAKKEDDCIHDEDDDVEDDSDGIHTHSNRDETPPSPTPTPTDLLLQLILANSLQLLGHLLGHTQVWFRFYFLLHNEQEAVLQDDGERYVSARSALVERRLLDSLRDKLCLLLSPHTLGGSPRDMASLLLGGVCAVSFMNPRAQEYMKTEGLMEIVLKWIRWPSDLISFSPDSEAKHHRLGMPLSSSSSFSARKSLCFAFARAKSHATSSSSSLPMLASIEFSDDPSPSSSSSSDRHGDTTPLSGPADDVEGGEGSGEGGDGMRPPRLVLDVRTMASLRSEYTLQLLATVAIAYAIHNCDHNALRMGGLGGWHQLLDLILWTTEVFAIDGYRDETSSLSPSGVKPLRSASRVWTDLRPIRKETTKELAQIFAILSAICLPTQVRLGGVTAGDNVSGGSGGPTVRKGGEDDKIIRLVVRTVVDLFSEELRQTPNNTRVRAKILHECGELQLHVVTFLTHLMLVHRPSLALCRRFQIWDLLFSKFFFFTPISPAVYTDNFDVNPQKDSALFGRLKEAILHFISSIATVDSHDNIDECRKMIDTLEGYATDVFIVHPVARCVSVVLSQRAEATLKGLERLNVLSVLACVIEQQTQAFSKTAGSGGGGRSGSTLQMAAPWSGSSSSATASPLRPNTTHSDECSDSSLLSLTTSSGRLTKTGDTLTAIARNMVVKLLCEVIQASPLMAIAALRDSRIVNSLIPLFFEPDMKLMAFLPVTHLMQFQPPPHLANDRVEADIVSLYHTFFTLLQHAQGGRLSSDFALLLDLLDLIVRITKKNPVSQKRFKDVGAFLHFINLLNTEKHADRLPVLCARVLSTFVAMLSNNPKNKKTLRLLGYDGLKRLVLRSLQADGSGYLRSRIIDLLVSLLIDDQYLRRDGQYMMIQSPDALPFLFQLCEHFDDSLKHELMDTFIPFVENNTLNRSLCCQQGVVYLLLEMIAKEKENLPYVAKMINVLEILGTHSITVPELKLLFFLLQEDVNGLRPRMQSLLLRALEYMCSSRSLAPEVFFTFDGTTAGMSLPPLAAFPTTNGYTFCTWLRIETFDVGLPKYQPQVLSFSSADVSLDVYFKREIVGGGGKGKRKGTMQSIARYTQFLVVQVTTPERAYRETFSLYPFDERRWYCISLTHQNHSRVPWKESEVRLYVDGKLEQKLNLKYPLFSSPTPSGISGYIGTSQLIVNRRQSEQNDPSGDGPNSSGGMEASSNNTLTCSPFFGQLGTIYFLDDVITPAQAKGFYDLGPMYSSCFQIADLSAPVSKSSSSLFEGGLFSKIVFCYNCKASEGKFYLDISPAVDATAAPSKPSARGLGHLNACVTRDVKSQIRCLGGIKIFLPLFAQVDQPLVPSEPSDAVSYESDPQFLYQVISCLNEMLRASDTNQHEFWKCHGFAVVGFLLRSLSFRHIGHSALDDVLPRFAAYVRHPESRREFFQSLFLDFRIWVYLPADVQLSALRVIRKWIIDSTTEDMQSLLPVTIQDFVDVLRRFYYYTPAVSGPLDLYGVEAWSHPHMKDISFVRPPPDDLKSIRRILFDIIHKILKSQTGGVSVKVVSALVRCVLDLPDTLQLEEMLEFMCWHLYHRVPGFEEALVALGGAPLFLLLLQNESESVRMLALEIIAKLPPPSTSSTEKASLFSVAMTSSTKTKRTDVSDLYVTAGSLLSTYPFREKTQRVLSMILVNRLRDTLGDDIDKGAILEMSEEVQIEVPEVFPLLLKLLQSADVILRQHTLQQIYLLVSNSFRNRNVFSKWFGWQNALFTLLADPETNSPGPEAESGSGSSEGLPQGARASSSPSSINVIRDLIMNILKVMILHDFQENKTGWKVIERTLAFLYPYALRGVLDYVAVTRRLFVEIVRGIKAEVQAISFAKTREVTDLLILRGHSSRMEGSPSFLLPNFLHFLGMVEQFVFYIVMIPDSSRLSSSSSVSSFSSLMNSPSLSLSSTSEGSSPLPPSSPFRVIQGAHVSKAGTWVDLPLIIDILDTLGHMDLLGTSSLLVDVASRAKISVVEANRISLRFALKACSEGGAETCISLFPRIRTIAQAFMMTSNKKKDQTVSQFVPYTLCNVLKIWRSLWMRRSRASTLPDVDGQDEGGERGRGDDWERVRRKLTLTDNPLASPDSLHRRRLAIEIKAEDASETMSSLLIPLVYELMQECIANLNRADPSFSSFERLATKAKVSEFLAELVETSGEHRWDFLHDYLEAATSRVRQQENEVCSTMEKDRAVWMNDVEEAMENEAALDVAAERKLIQEAKNLKEKLIQKEWRRRRKAKDTQEESDRRIGWRVNKLLRELTDEQSTTSAHGSMDKLDTHWKMDYAENYSRMRLKLRRNWNFDPHTGAAHELARGIGSSYSVDSSDGAAVPLDPIPDPILSIQGLKLSDILSIAKSGQGESSTLEEDVRLERLQQTSLSGEGTGVEEKKVYSTKCDLITPMKATPGRLEITTTHIYFWETMEARPKDELHRAPKDRKWRLDQIREIHIRRYLLRRSAIEFFLVTQTTAFFNFDPKERSKVYSKICDLNLPNLCFSDSGSPEEILKRSGLTRKWQMGLISNFDYLMQLNTIAGRTYNDLSQYPVFPWVLTNYVSDTLELENPANFRDLSKPMGALNEARLQQFLQRYRSFSDMDVPPFHYGSHYSNSAGVLFYLLRLEPYTSHFLKLQGGKFDIADRLFDSVEGAWNNCLTNPSDVKELIPEFFYLPEFLMNQNHFYFGKRKGGEGKIVDDVVLPPWAKNNPIEFIRIHREALESKAVSVTLHHWIDLIFGFKQQGKEAVEAVNVFYFLTYEGAVNLDAIGDETVRKATEAQIDHFGQTPSQLLKKPHPPKEMEVSSQYGVSQLMFSEAKKILVRPRYLEMSRVPIVFIGFPPFDTPSFFSNANSSFTDRVITIDRQRVAACNRWISNSQEGAPSSLLEVDPLLSQRRKIGVPFAPEVLVSPYLFSVTDDGRTIISCGHWDNSFKVSSFEGGRQSQSITWHKDIVTCLSLSRDSQTLVTGSKDTTVAVWNLQLRSSGYRVTERPSLILHGHNDEVTVVCVSVELDIVVSGAKDGKCIIHSLRKGSQLRSVNPTKQSILQLGVAKDKIVAYSPYDLTLHVLSLNGVSIASGDSKERLSCLVMTRNGKYVITGGNQGSVICRNAQNLEVVARWTAEAPITSIEMATDEQSILVGLEDGRLMILSVSGKS
jgi:hypothetical protein